jgi:glucose/arabinose dehydrogenase
MSSVKGTITMKRFLFVLIVVLMLAVSLQAQDQPQVVTTREAPPAADAVQLVKVVSSLIRPLYVTHAGDGSGRLFIVEQRGRIYVRENDALSIFLDITNLASPEANGSGYTERGLLGLAFHPDYATNGLFFVNYTDTAGNTVIRRYQVSADNPAVADAASGTEIFTLRQPFPNHNGGYITFGLDGYLYVAVGDGGMAGDPLEEGQNKDGLLGSILRLDVSAQTYSVPQSNPFVAGGGAPEIWSYGWRNPWRFSFDRATGDMYIGDVGQNMWEEISFEPAGSAGGLNYGWNIYEASHQYVNLQPVGEVVMPIAEYDHSQGCSVTGGYVYRGEAVAALQGVYLYGDYCSGNVWYAYRDPDQVWQSGLFLQTGFQISSFGEDEAGELYIVDYNGAIYQIVSAQ